MKLVGNEGFTVFFWATATRWNPLPVILQVWRHVPLRYETDDWDIVFPIGMCTVGTWEPAQALRADFLPAIPAAGVYVSLAAWLLIALIGLRRLYRKGLRRGTYPPHWALPYNGAPCRCVPPCLPCDSNAI